MNRISRRSARTAIGAAAAVAALAAPAAAQAGQGYVVALEPAGSTCQAAINDVSRAYGISPRILYTSSMCGFSASLSKRTAEALRLDPRVRSVTQDGAVSIG